MKRNRLYIRQKYHWKVNGSCAEKTEKKEEVKVEYVKPEEKVVKVKASIQFTVPKIEDDDKVVQEKEMKTQDDIQSLKNISIAAQTYEGDGEGGINIDDLKEDQKAGGTEAPKEEEVVDNAIVEVQATYPGGEAAILQHIAKNLQYLVNNSLILLSSKKSLFSSSI